MPEPGPQRDRLLARLMGSPDVLQIDGLGGGRPITSKVAIIAPSSRPDADVDYTFAQVDLPSASVGYAGNCGNISSGVGPFAIDEGLVEAREGLTRVRIYNTNTGKLLVADVPVHGGRAAVDGDYVIPGVPGTGAEIAMNWAGTIGAATGQLLPTGRPTNNIVLESGRTVRASLFDAANPCVWVRGSDFGLDGTESQAQINGDTGLRAAVAEVRNQDFVTTLRAMGLGEGAVIRHTLKNASPQVLAVMGLQFGYLMGGSILVETVFTWPGSGFLLNKAIINRDIPVLQGTILALSLVFVLTNLIVDLLQATLDPRIRRA